MKTKSLKNNFGPTVFVIGGGHSLKNFNFELLKGKGYVLSLNEAGKIVPCSNGVFSADPGWIRKNVEFLKETEQDKFFAVFTNDVEGIECTRFEPVFAQSFFSADPQFLHIQGNTGYAALNMLYHMNVRSIYLLGYDFTLGHFHEAYHFDPHNRNSLESLYAKWARAVDECAYLFNERGIKVFKTNSRSLIRKFPLIDLRAVLGVDNLYKE